VKQVKNPFNVIAGKRIRAVILSERRGLSEIAKQMDPPISRGNFSLKLSGINHFYDYEMIQIVEILNKDRIRRGEYKVEGILNGIYATKEGHIR
jgi:hypothetical protein